MSKKKNKKGTVYSTDPNFKYEYDDNDDHTEDIPFSQQKIYVSIDRKQRRGKEVTLVEGFIGSDEQFKDLAKMLKSKCGVGGSAKGGEIMVQGNHREKVIDLLKAAGFGKVISKGG